MLTVSEVGIPGKLACKALLIGLFFLSALPARAEENRPSTDVSLDRLGDCQWKVTYRGRTYDLAPLTRESLSRPIENDIRYALQRVPSANEHLEAMSGKLRNARTYTILASIFIGTAIVSHLMRKTYEPKDTQRAFRTATWASGGLFLTTALFSWHNTSSAKKELVEAVKEFNEHSSYKIEPATGGIGTTE